MVGKVASPTLDDAIGGISGQGPAWRIVAGWRPRLGRHLPSHCIPAPLTTCKHGFSRFASCKYIKDNKYVCRQHCSPFALRGQRVHTTSPCCALPQLQPQKLHRLSPLMHMIAELSHARQWFTTDSPVYCTIRCTSSSRVTS